MKQANQTGAVFVLTVVAALASALVVPAVHAAGIKQDEQRVQVKMERDEFFRTHRWDHGSTQWVLKDEALPPQGVKSRAEIKAERDAFLRTHKWDREQGWVPLKLERNLSTRTRAEVRAEAAQFARTHRWDEGRDSFVSNSPAFSRR